jgi:hypothetical protein
MKGLILGDRPTVERLAERLKRARSRSEYQRIQCVLIRATVPASRLGFSWNNVLRNYS